MKTAGRERLSRPAAFEGECLMPKGWFVLIRGLALGLVLLYLGGCLHSRAVPITGTLQGELFWQGRVLLTGDVIVEKGATLTIASGTEVVFLPAPAGLDLLVDHPNFPGSELIVKGSIQAEGTAEAPVVFRHLDPAAPPGSWGAVNLAESPRAIFRYCRFTQADSAVHSQQSGTVVIQNCLFEKNLVGIRFFSTDMLIENNTLRENGAGVRFHFGSPVVRRNLFENNGRAFFITSFPRAYRIEYNNILSSRDYQVVLGEEVPDDVLLPHNFWGTTDRQRIESRFFDGRRDHYLGQVCYLPLASVPVEKAGISWIR